MSNIAQATVLVITAFALKVLGVVAAWLVARRVIAAVARVVVRSLKYPFDQIVAGYLGTAVAVLLRRGWLPGARAERLRADRQLRPGAPVPSWALPVRYCSRSSNPDTEERGMSRRSPFTIGLTMLGLTLAGLTPPRAEAQKPVVYPAKGQSAEQQQKDQAECDLWAKQTTGIDPVAVATAPAPAPGSTVGGGQRLGGAARGAAGGALIGAIAGDAGTGAAAGAVVGTMSGGRRARQQQAQQQQAAEAQKQQTINTYYRAFSACLEGRGYAIK